MSDQSGSSHLRILFEAALEDYKQQTGIDLAKHPLAGRLQQCNSVESVTTLLREQAQDFKEFQEKDKILNPLKKVLTILHSLLSGPIGGFAQHIGLHFPPVKAIETGLGILLSAVKGVIDDYSALADLLESIGQFLNRLEIYTQIPPTEALNEMIVKILVELLSTLALTTKEIKQGKLQKLVRKLVGEKKMDAMVQRLDRLTQDEARQTVVEILKVVHGLVENMKVVMDDGEVSVDHLKETLEIMHQVASDLNKAKRDGLQKDIFGWLSAPDPWKNHYAACKSRHHGTAEWFLHGNTYSEWRTSEVSSSLLWVHGKPGAGKSVFCSAVIKDIIVIQKAGLASLAFFYCDFREDRKMELRGLLSSFLVQLYHQSDSYFDILSKLYSDHDKGSRPPDDDVLVGCLKDLLKLPGLAPVYLIVDALDECPNQSVVRSPRSEVLSLIEGLVETRIPNLRVCVTSRPEPDIKVVLDTLIFHSVSLHDESGQMRDIEDYIKSIINTRTTRRWKVGLRKLAIEVLTEKSYGSFRWVDCQVVRICNFVPAVIRHALAELPETLDETYEQALRRIKKENWEIAHCIFQFVSVATRPLRVKELADLLAFDFKAGLIPKFYEDYRLEDPADAVLSTCSTLLAIVDDQGSPVIQFSHFSVKEYLTSTRLAEVGDLISRRYYVSMIPAHTLAAKVCLGILLHLDQDVTTDSVKDFPLTEYAAEHWVDHAQFEDVSENVADGMKQLFDPIKPHLAIWVWIYDPTVSRWEQETQIKRSKPLLSLPQTSLHYVASLGLHSLVESLITEHSQDVRSRDSRKDATPLHLASRNGHVEAACKLIEHGADLTAQDDDGQTPLHHASQRGQADLARMLIERGADLTAQSKDGLTPLHLASQQGQLDVARFFIKHGADTTAQSKDGRTPLHLASQQGQLDVARFLIEHGADPTSQSKDGQTPLHLASQQGQLDVARFLIEHGADPTAQCNGGQTPLHLASQCGQLYVARFLIEHGADPTAQSKDGQTPLHLASQCGQLYVTRFLIEHGADPTAQSNDGQTPLHLASQCGQLDVARFLINHGADPTAQSNDGRTPLHFTLQWGQVDIARFLINHGADPTSQINDERTPLYIASQRRRVDVARFLIEHGADPAAQSNDGQTPLHLASQQGQLDVACFLIEHGADPTAQSNDGRTPLHLASQQGQLDVARFLIEHGADPTAQDNDGQTPLHFAGQVDVSHFFIEPGVDPTVIKKHRETPLHLVSHIRIAQYECAEIAHMLLEHGADGNARNNDGLTPFELASRRGHTEMMDVLVQHGTASDAYENADETLFQDVDTSGSSEAGGDSYFSCASD